MYEGGTVVAKGTWLYDDTVECEVLIQLLPVCYGSGDDGDPPELRENREQDTFYIWYGSSVKRGAYPAGGGHAASLEEAKALAEKTLGRPVRWE